YFVPHIDFKNGKHSLMERVSLAAHAVYSSDARHRLERFIQEFRPDVAHVRNIYHHLSPSIFWELKAHHVPVVYHLNDFKLECPKRRQSHLPGTHPFFISVVFRKKKESAISCERCGTCPAFDYASPGTAHCGPNWKG